MKISILRPQFKWDDSKDQIHRKPEGNQAFKSLALRELKNGLDYLSNFYLRTFFPERSRLRSHRVYVRPAY